ncbi:hypothetical protein Rhal01_02517 [Rubritalea halochordaticola]|uniref:Uncharacterized protein n=1 Tax=Rubritalea halochordaticola TaxID=714537 RepID=A0ABP9V0W0_9BACT
MKILITPLLALSILTAYADETTPEKKGIIPAVSQQFGQVIEVKVVFVEKPNTYYAQNMVKASCYAKILEVNGKKLEQPVVLEYRCADVDFKLGSQHTLTAYEDLQSSGVNREWDGKIRQFNYGISHFIRLRNPALPKAKKPYTIE